MDEIEWEYDDEKQDNERELEDIDDEEEINEHDVIKEFSTLALEDVQQMSSNDQSDPIVLISSGDSYSGDIDEFFLIEAPNSQYSAADMMADAKALTTTTTSTTTKTMHEFSADGTEKVTIIKEEIGPEGEIIVTQETEEYPSLRVVNSDSDTDEDQVSPTENLHDAVPRAANNLCKTFGSSSGSDIALHEPGAESSDDETGTV